MSNIAILSGRGILPHELSQSNPDALVVSFEGVGIDFEPKNLFEAQFEKAGALFKALQKNDVTKVCLAGAMSRPKIKMSKLDLKTMKLLPTIQKAIASSDGGTMSIVRALLEAEGFEVIGAHEICPDMLAGVGALGAIKPKDDRGLERALSIHADMAKNDVGQALVMRWGQCLAVESLPGTAAMLKFVADNSDDAREAEGYLYKNSKAGQDIRLDMASIGPDTIDQVVQAGLAGIYLGAGKVLMLGREELIARADKAGVFVVGLA